MKTELIEALQTLLPFAIKANADGAFKHCVLPLACGKAIDNARNLLAKCETPQPAPERTIADSEVQEMICLLRCFVSGQDSDDLDAAAALLNRIGELPDGICPQCLRSIFDEYANDIELLTDMDERPAGAAADNTHWCNYCEESFGVKRA